MISKDILWKGILEDIFDDFLRYMIPNAEEIIDFEKGFVFLDKELNELFSADENAGTAHVDKLVQVYAKSGEEEWILVHVEVQGYYDNTFARRMFRYFTRIFEKYNKPVTAFAIFTDNQPGFFPSVYEYDFVGTRLTYKYNIFKVLEQARHLTPN
jgi:hypothetical protein